MEHETNTHILPKARIHKTKADKPKSIVETKVPTQVLHWQSQITYLEYSKFGPRLSQIIGPLYLRANMLFQSYFVPIDFKSSFLSEVLDVQPQSR